MPRPKQDPFDRIARFTGLPSGEALRAFVDNQNPDHLFWQGQFKPKEKTLRPAHEHTWGYPGRPYLDRPKPYLKPYGHPTRLLLAHFHGVDQLDRLVHIKNRCGDLSCINPLCYAMFARTHMRTGRRGTLPYDVQRDPYEITDADREQMREEDIAYLLEELAKPNPDIEELEGSPNFLEAMRRHQAIAPAPAQ